MGTRTTQWFKDGVLVSSQRPSHSYTVQAYMGLMFYHTDKLYSVELSVESYRHLYSVPSSDSTLISASFREWCWRNGSKESILYSKSRKDRTIVYSFRSKRDLRWFVLTWL